MFCFSPNTLLDYFVSPLGYMDPSIVSDTPLLPDNLEALLGKQNAC